MPEAEADAVSVATQTVVVGDCTNLADEAGDRAATARGLCSSLDNVGLKKLEDAFVRVPPIEYRIRVPPEVGRCRWGHTLEEWTVGVATDDDARLAVAGE